MRSTPPTLAYLEWAFSHEELESHGGARGEEITNAGLELSSALDQMERKDLGVRAWGRKMRGGELSRRAKHGVGRMSELLGERESDLNDVGPKPTKQVQPVRPVALNGQTGPTELSQQNLISEFYRLCFSQN